MGRLEGKVAIVTGATSGMGKRTAEPFVREGATVIHAHMAVFPASHESSFVTGQDIIVDGGQIRARRWTPQQEGLRQLKQAFGLPAEG